LHTVVIVYRMIDIYCHKDVDIVWWLCHLTVTWRVTHV